jgi:peroxidase
MRKAVIALAVVAFALIPSGAAVSFPIRTLDGSQNNERHPDWGRTNTEYARTTWASYADGVAQPLSGPPARSISNRIFNDTSQNLFSEHGVTQWGFVWGQFMDHTFGLRQEDGGENAPIAFDADDPLEAFRNDFGSIAFSRTPAARGTGVDHSPRQQINTVSSYIDGFSVYGGTPERLEWLREGPVDGQLANNGPELLLDDGYLPRRDARGNAAAAPTMAADGRLAGRPDRAMVAGDVRANENIALTATHTLFAREHNRIVAALPPELDAETKFEIARRIVGAEQQYVTYNEFLPALGVTLSPYRGYDPNVDPSLSNEFAVVGYRAHSMIHGELESEAERPDYTAARLDAIRAQGAEVEVDGDELEFVVPLNVAFFNPDLLRLIGVDAVLAGIGSESQYKNDEQIDNQLRSVLFQVPVPGNPGCLDGPTLPSCFHGVADVAAIDIERGRDHGIPRYNDLRKALKLKKKRSFTEITGEWTDLMPADPELDAANPIDDADVLDFLQLFDRDGNGIELGSPAADSQAVVGVRRTTTAARLKAIYGDVDNVDAFVGMAAEQHVPGSELGELQLEIWRRQFEGLRDGDRFFYLNDPVLKTIEHDYGITYRHTLGELIELNTDADVADDVFHVPPAG